MTMPCDIADALLVKTCHSICALVCLSRQGDVLDVALFDPLHYRAPREFAAETAEIWLIANHECGNESPRPCEWQQFEETASLAKGITVRLFLSSEYWDCREICVAQQHVM